MFAHRFEGFALKDGMHKALKKLWMAGKAHGGKVAYYGGIMLVLGAIAVAAEAYRGRFTRTEPLVLPPAEVEISAVQTFQEPVFVLPENLSIMRSYSQLPQWNDALGLWETHTAVDYRCEDGQVCSLTRGIVQTIGTSGVYGGFIEVETQQYLLRYASIAPDEALKAGDSVAPGAVLGVADNSMPGEEHQGAHLHLELEYMGERVNILEHAEDACADVE